MTVAWGTIVALILLLPGFMAFTGLYSSEQFSRDTTPKSRIAQLAVIVLIAFLVHSTLIIALKVAAACGATWCDVSVRSALQVLIGPDKTPGGATSSRIAANLDQHAELIVVYVIASVGMGLGGGWLLGRTMQGPLKALLQHKWVYDIAPPRGKKTGFAPFAYVLTSISAESRFLCYSGPVLDFSLDRDGNFSYLVLLGASRSYLQLEDEVSKTSRGVGIGHTSQPNQSHDQDRLYLTGDSILNVVFETFSFSLPQKLPELLRDWDSYLKDVVPPREL